MIKACGQLFVLLLSTLLGCNQPAPEVWPQFRGLNSQGVATSQNAPIEFGPEKTCFGKPICHRDTPHRASGTTGFS